MDEQGYELLRGAVEAAAIDAYTRERAEAMDGLLVREHGAEHVELASQAHGEAGAIDPYAVSPAARAVLLPPAITDVLTARFADTPPLLFDAAETAAAAPEDGPYRDATYTALATEPETLVTLVVALGETHLDVYPGSQQIETTLFSGRYHHVNPERDGDEALTQHRAELTTQLGEAETLALNAGDALLLAAGTVHRPVQGAALVAHACPTTIAPSWFAYRPERARHASIDDGRAWIASQHYDLVDAIAPEHTPRRDELEQVEEALREHDRELATEPQPGTSETRRAGGLVDSVRGILGRRRR